MESQTKLKEILTTFKAGGTAEGDGVTVKRFIGVKELPLLDPFLLLDLGSFKLPAGFPEHPHRGFETVSYILEGQIDHEDSKGHKGLKNKGDV